RDGSSSSSPLLGTFCGTDMPPRLQSTQRSLFVRCGATMTSPTGVIVSPGHPNTYPHGANCTWFISVSPGSLIRLSFDSFNLEYHTNCNLDYVELYDNGTVETGTKLGRYLYYWCGTNRPPVLLSHSNRLWVRFHSDATVTRRGFTAHWDAFPLLCSSGCGGTMFSASGGFSSPNYPLPYHPNAECYWSLRTSPGSQLLLSFSDFHLESSINCDFDYLALYNGPNSQAPLLGTFCGDALPAPGFTTTSALTVVFRSDSSVTRTGFQMLWSQIGESNLTL
uniref:CUB domain-containing protein n=1 Tax=Periophthalmus magnuspinnatus TaxID=409849 RepID=A0A3B4B209_9GOBI